MGLSSSKPKIPNFNFDPVQFYGTWIEIGRYADPQESVCNDVQLTVGPMNVINGEGLRVLRVCGCRIDSPKQCGLAEVLEWIRIKTSNTYSVSDPRSDQEHEVSILWTDYRSWTILGSSDRLWIFGRSGITVTKESILPLYLKVLQLGYEPEKVHLTGLVIRQLAAQQIYTGTLIAPFCSVLPGKLYGSDKVCSK